MRFKLLNITALLCLLILSNIGLGQSTKTNPFEVSQRIQVNSDKSQDVVNPGQHADTTNLEGNTNPFEVNHVPIRRENFRNLESSIKQISNVKTKVSENFIFWIMIFSWAILAVVITNKTKLISFLLRSIFNVNMLKLTKREEASGYNFHFALLYLCFFINISVFVYLLQRHFSNQIGIKIWALIGIAILGIYAVRHLFLFLLGMVFPLQKEASLFSYTILVFNILLGITIIPLNLILSYSAPAIHLSVLYIGLGLIVLFYLLRSIRGLSTSIFLIGQGIVPFFIYLCVAEIAPLLVLFRAISNISG